MNLNGLKRGELLVFSASSKGRTYMNLNTNNMLDVTNVDMILFIKTVYDLSKPVGMGFLHYTPEPMTDEQAKLVFEQDKNSPFKSASNYFNLDYVKGRACKMTVHYGPSNTLWIDNKWYDHSDNDLIRLRSICNF